MSFSLVAVLSEMTSTRAVRAGAMTVRAATSISWLSWRPKTLSLFMLCVSAHTSLPSTLSRPIPSTFARATSPLSHCWVYFSSVNSFFCCLIAPFSSHRSARTEVFSGEEKKNREEKNCWKLFVSRAKCCNRGFNVFRREKEMKCR